MEKPFRCIIKVGYACNNSCTFCHCSGSEPVQGLTVDEAATRVQEAKDLGFTSVLFSGGEPTIMKDFQDLAHRCALLQMPFGLVTNGRMLSYRPLMDALLLDGLNYVYLSLHGPRPLHERISRAPGSFSQTLSAIAGLNRKETVETTCNVVVTSANLEALKDMVTLLKPLETVRLKFTYVEPKGRAAENPSVVPDIVQAAQRVSRAIDFGRTQAMPLERFAVDGFPHCLDHRFGALQDDMFTHGIRAIREVQEERFFPIDYKNMSRSEKCLGCMIGAECRCTWTGALERFGDEFLRPVTGGVANSFNYFPLPRGDRGEEWRTVNVIDGNKRFRCSTDTADFSKREVVAIRDESQQVYLQVDDAVDLSDFPKQLVKLHRERQREDGEKSGPKSRAPYFVPERRDLFQQAEARLRHIINRISGDVLDVGCGDIRFLDTLKSKLESGSVRYTGVDPAPGADLIALEKKKKVKLVRSTIESMQLSPESLDWVLVLRSHNHLLDLWTAYTKMVDALKWGGALVVVDNVPFAVVRAKVSKESILALPPGGKREHLRNHSDRDAIRYLSKFPLVLVESLSIGPNSANQWSLRFKKGWPGPRPEAPQPA